MATAKKKSTEEAQVEPTSAENASENASGVSTSESAEKPHVEEPQAAPTTQVILSRGPSQSAIRREKLGFDFPEGKKESLSDGTTIYRF